MNKKLGNYTINNKNFNSEIIKIDNHFKLVSNF